MTGPAALLPDGVIIIGASAAGIAAARALRAKAYSGPVTVIDGDPHPPYEKPPLSKKVIEDSAIGPLDIPLLAAGEAEKLGITLRLGQKVEALVKAPLGVTLTNGETLGASAILLATGGRAVRLRLPGADLPGIHVIRSFDDAAGLRRDLASAEAVAVIGGGLIGTEAAVALAKSGKQIHWIDAAPKPLAHILPEALADYLIAHHLALGLTLHAGARLSGFTAEAGHVSGISFADGSHLPVQAVIMGVGMAPDQILAEAAGLAVSAGIHVDDNFQTSHPGIYAAGDVASLYDAAHDKRQRHEHWRAAEEQGANAAAAMLGQAVSPPSVAWFWSDQGTLHIEMAGHKTGDSVIRPGKTGPIVFEMAGDRLAGVATAGDVQAVRIGLRLIQGGKPVDRASLADPAVELRGLLRR